MTHIFDDTHFDDLPIEIIMHYLFPYLDDIDIFHLSKTGNSRLKELCDSYVKIGKYQNRYCILDALSKILEPK